MGGFAVLAVGAAVLAGDLLSPPASTADGDFAGETLELLIPLAEGGGTDTWARFIGTELTHALPGSPGFAPTNEAGGEGITGIQPLLHLRPRRRHRAPGQHRHHGGPLGAGTPGGEV